MSKVKVDVQKGALRFREKLDMLVSVNTCLHCCHMVIALKYYPIYSC